MAERSGAAEPANFVSALVIWDERNRGEVLAVPGRAIARVIQSLAALPAPGVPAGLPS